jgi:hypothetical protein
MENREYAQKFLLSSFPANNICGLRLQVRRFRTLSSFQQRSDLQLSNLTEPAEEEESHHAREKYVS